MTIFMGVREVVWMQPPNTCTGMTAAVIPNCPSSLGCEEVDHSMIGCSDWNTVDARSKEIINESGRDVVYLMK